MGDPDAMIRVDHVTKVYGDRPAVTDLSLSIGRGEIFCFLGPNGAGKTTTIKMLVGLLRPTSGSIAIAGHDALAQVLKVRGLVSYIPDQPYLYDKLTGRELLAFVGELYRMDDARLARRTDEMIRTFALERFVDGLCESYSHGMKQRVVLACALLHEPAVLVVDEPMVGLDPKSKRLVTDLFKAEAARGAAVFISTHSLEVAEEVAHRVGIMHRGALKALGTIGELRAARHADARLEEIFLEITAEADDPVAVAPLGS